MELLPILDKYKKKALYIQLYDYIRIEILNNKIQAFEKLPSIRQLSKDINISKTTVATAYGQLIVEGYVESRPYKGYFVRKIENYDIEKPLKDINLWKEIKNREKNVIKVIDSNSSPIVAWKKYYGQVLKNDADIFFSYGDEQGEKVLRYEIVKYLHQSRGVNCSEDQIVIGGGIQNLLFLLMILLKNKVKVVGIEEPGFKKAIRLFEDMGFNICPILAENDKIMNSLVENNHIDLLYLTPSHQFPMGSVMSINKRLEVLKWADKESCYIIEDDYDSELRYKGNPIPSLQGIDRNNRVIYMGSISKIMTPAIRISYMILPESLKKIYDTVKYRYSQTASRIDQLALAAMMIDGEFEKHIRRIRKLYTRKNEKLIACLKKTFGSKIRIIGEETGLHILVELDIEKNLDISDLELDNKNVKLISIDEYYYDKLNINKKPQYLLSYAGIEEENLENIIKELYKKIFD